MAEFSGAIVAGLRGDGSNEGYFSPDRFSFGVPLQLRRPRGVELVNSPWDEYSHTADLRTNLGRDGLRSIRGLNSFVHAC